MFKICGYPIAMGNAIQELKDIAYDTTLTNDDSGVAAYLEKLHGEFAANNVF